MKKGANQLSARILSLFLALVMVMGLLPTAAMAEEAVPTDAELVAEAMAQFTWESFASEPQDAVTTSPYFPSEISVGERTVSITWSCDDTTGAVSIYGTPYLTRPAAEDVTCNLTASLTYQTASDTKIFSLTIKAEGVNPEKTSVVHYGELMQGIAAGYSTSADGWVVLEMAAYNGQSAKSDSYNGYSATAEALGDAALGLSATLDFTDVYLSIYNTPYIFMAYALPNVTVENCALSAEDIKGEMLDYLNGGYYDPDTLSPVLSALSTYYLSGDTEVVTAVNKGVTWLSENQNADGTFSSYGTANSNSTAMVVTALSALGIDAHTDSRFIKTSGTTRRSAVEGLLSYALADNSGFGYQGNVTRNDMATEQGFRALVAYAKMVEKGSGYQIYVEAQNSTAAVAAPSIAATRPVSSDSGSSSGKVSYQIRVSVMVPPSGGEDGQYTYTANSASYTNLLGIVKTVTVSSTDSALTALVKALDSANISYVEKSGYVSKIGTLAERDHGANSGWQYLVNGSAPTVGAGDYTFKKNATMVWYFTDDYTKEQSSFDSNDSGSNSSSGTPTTETTTPSTTTPAESLPFADVAQDHWAAQSIVFVHDRGLMVGMADGSFSPDSTASRAMIATILWSLESSPEASSDGVFSDVHSGSWYAVPAAWAMENGIVSGYPDGSFAPDAGVTREQLALMFYHWANLRGLDTTVTGQPLSEFQDASGASDWAKDALDWAVSAGLLSGKSATTLDPAGTATRAELAVILTRLVELSES